MQTQRTLAIAMAAAGILAGLTVTAARACDNDRYPCPIVSPAPDVAEPAAKPSRKKASHAARRDDKSRAKSERQGSQASFHANAIAPAEQAIISAPQKAPEPSAALNNAVDRDESPASATAAAGVVLPNTAAAAAEPAAAAETAAAPSASEVKVVDPHELNELDLAAASAPTAESSWLSYLLMTLGAALAAASGLRFLFV